MVPLYRRLSLPPQQGEGKEEREARCCCPQPYAWQYISALQAIWNCIKSLRCHVAESFTRLE